MCLHEGLWNTDGERMYLDFLLVNAKIDTEKFMETDTKTHRVRRNRSEVVVLIFKSGRLTSCETRISQNTFKTFPQITPQ
jgi:hypothetical protein